MPHAALRLVSVAIASCVLGVFGVPVFAQSDSASRSAVALDRTSSSAAREYVAAELAFPAPVALPPNLLVSASHRPLLESMLGRSITFRRQCQRIANAPHLTVRLQRSTRSWTQQTRARTRIRRYRFGALHATIEVPPLDDDVELIAHEIEHVIEQLDEVDLAARARRTDSGVRASAWDDAVFETLRAKRIGSMVAQEVRRAGR